MADFRDSLTENLTVMSTSASDQPCGRCGGRRLLFYSHLFKENKVEALCKPCAIVRAGGEEKIWVHSDTYLQRRWEKNGRLDAPAHIARKRKPHQNPGAEGLTDVSQGVRTKTAV